MRHHRSHPALLFGLIGGLWLALAIVVTTMVGVTPIAPSKICRFSSRQFRTAGANAVRLSTRVEVIEPRDRDALAPQVTRPRVPSVDVAAAAAVDQGHHHAAPFAVAGIFRLSYPSPAPLPRPRDAVLLAAAAVSYPPLANRPPPAC